MRTQILFLVLVFSALLIVQAKQAKQAQQDDDDDDDDAYCWEQCQGRPMEYRYNPISASWKAHFAMAFQMDCELASITSPFEQQAALQAMEPYLGYPYHISASNATSYSFEASFVYLGARTVESDPKKGRYLFEWMDGSGEFEVTRNKNSLDPYTNFLMGDPNGNGDNNVEDETYLAMSLNENDSAGVPRGMWIDFGLRNSPALYKCCAPAPPKPTCKKEYHINPIPATWEEHAIMAREMSCELASVTNPEEQGQVEALVASLDTMAAKDGDGLANLGGSFLYMGARRILSKLPNRYIFEWTDGSGQVEYGVTNSYNKFAEPTTTTTSTVNLNPPSGRDLYLAISLTNDPTPPVESTNEETQRGPALYQCCHEHGGSSRCQR